jgi:hypothetical protein
MPVGPPPLMPSLQSPTIPAGILESLNEQAARKIKAVDSTNFLADFQRASLASAFAEKLMKSIAHFDASLDADHEVGMKLVTFGQAIMFHVEEVRYANPSLIFFRGTTPDGNRVALMQHVSQISFLLMALPKPDANQPKRKFGFHPPEPQEPQQSPVNDPLSGK